MTDEWRQRGRFWLQRQIDQRQWSKADFSRRLPAPHGTVSRWLAGKQPPNPHYAERIANLLGADLDEVLVLAGHRPAVYHEDNPTVRETVALMRQLPLSEQEEVCAYARFRRERVQARPQRVV